MKKKRKNAKVSNKKNDSSMLNFFGLIDGLALVVWVLSTLVAFVTAIFYMSDLYPSFLNHSTNYTVASWLISSLLIIISSMSDNRTELIDKGLFSHIFITAPAILMLIVSAFLPFPFPLAFVMSLFGYVCLLVLLLVLLYAGFINKNIHWQ